MDDILVATQLTYSYGGGRNAIDGVDLRVRRASIHGLVGDNGSGKSTTLAILARHRRLQSGRLSVGVDGDWRSLRLGWMASDDSALPRGPVGSFLAKVLGPCLGLNERHAAQRTAAFAERLGVAELLGRDSQKLSHGQRVRFSILAAFLETPDLVLLDEPFQGLDPTATDRVRAFLLLQQRESGVSILVSDHRLEVLDGMCDAWTFLREGRSVGHLDREDLGEDASLASVYRDLQTRS